MQTSLKLATLAAAALFGLSAQAQTTLSPAEAEVWGVALPQTVQQRTESQPVAVSGLTRGEVTAEYLRAYMAGELDFAYAEVNGGALPRGSVRAGGVKLATR